MGEASPDQTASGAGRPSPDVRLPMSPFTAADRVSASTLLVVGASQICAEFGAGSWTRLAAGVGLLVFFVLQWRSVATIARATVVAAVLLMAFLWGSGRIGLETVEAAVGRAAFFTLFIISLDFLRHAAMTSETVLRSGAMIVRQPPGRRYLMLTIGGHLLGVLLNLGAVHVLGSLARRAIEEGSEGAAGVREIRLRRMTTALLRGFATTTLWAPTSITVAVVLSTLPSFNWLSFLPGALATAACVLTLGWVLDRLTFPRSRPQPPREPFLGVLIRLLPLVMINVLLIGCTLLASTLLSVRLILGLILCVPLFGISWIVVQYSPLGLNRAFTETQKRVRRHIVPSLVGLRSEIGILAASGSLSVLLVSQKDPATFAAAFAWLGLTNGAVLAVTAIVIFVIALIGINPIISVTVALEMLLALPGLEASSFKLALLGTIGWMLSTGFSPLSATVRLTARNVGRPAHVVGCVWNGTFTAALLAILCVVLLLPY